MTLTADSRLATPPTPVDVEQLLTTGSRAELEAGHAQLKADRDWFERERERLEDERNHAQSRRGDAYKRQMPGQPAHRDEIEAEAELTSVERDLDRVRAWIEAAATDLSRLDTAVQHARAAELLEIEAHNLEAYPRIAMRLLEHLLDASNDLGEEHSVDIYQYQVKSELNGIAEKTGDSRYRRTVFAFAPRFIRPQLRDIGGAIEALIKQLGVNIEKGRIVPRGPAVVSSPSSAVPDDDQVDDDIDDEDPRLSG